MIRKNCWEYKNCGRVPGGSLEHELGICPAYTENRTDKINNGKNGGRACWVISGTYCEGQVQGIYASKLSSCINCEFYNLVQKEEGKDWKGAKQILELL